MTGRELALATIRGEATKGIPPWLLNVMELRMIDRLAGLPEGSYEREPEPAYLAMQRRTGCCMIDQYLWDNPLTMRRDGYGADTARGATTGAEAIIRDGMAIDSPEAAVEHMERFVIPGHRAELAAFDADRWTADIIADERAAQERIGPDILKGPYGFVQFPRYLYDLYGYVNYFMAYALYPEVVEREMSAMADLWVLRNAAAAKAFEAGGLPPFIRLDYDMADSRGTLTSVESLDKIWLPHFARAIEPLARAPITVIWHCDGNLSKMVPRLLDVGIKGFQGFQYEDDMDYEAIARMKTRDGGDLLIIAGVSVTRTLPFGTPADVKRELEWLVKYGPKQGLFLGGSSSITPGVPWENLEALADGLCYYREHGRG